MCVRLTWTYQHTQHSSTCLPSHWENKSTDKGETRKWVMNHLAKQSGLRPNVTAWLTTCQPCFRRLNVGCESGAPSVPYMQTFAEKPLGRGFKRVGELPWSSVMSSLNPCLKGLRQLIVQATTPATTCLTTEGWAKCAATWHWLMTVAITVLIAACTLILSLTSSFHLSGKIWIYIQ